MLLYSILHNYYEFPSIHITYFITVISTVLRTPYLGLSKSKKVPPPRTLSLDVWKEVITISRLVATPPYSQCVVRELPNRLSYPWSLGESESAANKQQARFSWRWNLSQSCTCLAQLVGVRAFCLFTTRLATFNNAIMKTAALCLNKST